VALAEHRNFARAAETLYITQSALTRSIQALESRVGAKLFDRGPREVTPTMLGELVLRHAAALELASRDLQRDIELAQGVEIGDLRIAAGPFAGAVLVSNAVGALSVTHPRLRVEVVIGPWRELPERLRQREVDLMVGDLSDVESLDGFEVLALRPHPQHWVCRAGHPLTELRKPTLADVLAHPLAAPNLPAEVLAWLRAQMPEEQRRPTGSPLTITCDSSEALKRILSRSDAVTMMSDFMLEDELADGRFVVLRHVGESLPGRYGAAWLSGRTVSAPARAFLDVLVAEDEARTVGRG
jgi:DNA-binding transcriptional LysR family regulator